MTMTTTATAIKTTAKQKRPITLTTTETVTNNEVTNYKYSGNNITDNIFFCHNDCDRNTVATTATATTTTTAATTTAATTTAATTTKVTPHIIGQKENAQSLSLGFKDYFRL